MAQVLTFTTTASNQHSEIVQKLDAVNRSYGKCEINYDMKLGEIKDSVIEAIKDIQIDLSTHGAQLASL